MLSFLSWYSNVCDDLRMKRAKRQVRFNKPIRVSKAANRTADGITFDSIKEMERYKILRSLRRLGKIDFFLMQVPFILPGPVRYRLDFMVFWADKTVTFEDVKGHKTDLYILKKKQVEELYGIEIEEK